MSAPRSPFIRALEPRLLYDGAAAGEALHVATDQTHSTDHVDAGQHGEAHASALTHQATRSPLAIALEASQQARDHKTSDTAQDDGHDASGRERRHGPDRGDARAVQQHSRAHGGNNVMFVDSNVRDYQQLVNEVGPDADVVVIDGEHDGVDQMAAAMSDRSDVSSVHVLSHGRDGELMLGTAHLNRQTMDGRYAADLADIGRAMSDDGDLMIYGCDFGAGTHGQAAVDALARHTGADVAASTDDTGSRSDGGDWTLETHDGVVDSPSLDFPAYDGVLAPPTVDVPDKSLTVDEDASLPVSGVSVGDADGDNLNVTLSVDNGALTLGTNNLADVSGDGTGSITINDASAADINGALGNLSYQGDANYNGGDTLAIAASDGDTTTDKSLGINITPVNDDPTLNPASNLSVDEGASGQFTALDFGLNDPDLDTDDNTAQQEVFQVKSLPSDGQLLFNGNQVLEGSTFSSDQIGNLSYQHDGSNVAMGDTDTFSVQVNDGGDTSAVTDITINLQPENQAPQITGTDPSVFEGQGAEPNDDGSEGIALGLGYTDQEKDTTDTPGNVTVELDNIETDGDSTLYLDSDGNGKLGSGETVSDGDTFTADQLDALRFNHNGTEPDGTNPTFDVTLTDNGGGEGAGNALSTTQNVSIDVKPNDDDPVLATNTGTSVDGGNTVALTTAMLESTDVDSPNPIYTVDDIPDDGELQINDNGTFHTLGASGQFTQADIDNGRVRYVQNASVGANTSDSFDFSVRDGDFKAFNDAGQPGAVRDSNGNIAENTFNIDINSANTTGTGPGAPDPGYSGGDIDLSEVNNTGLNPTQLSEGDGQSGGDDTSLITSDRLHYDITRNGSQLSPSEVRYRLTSLPGNGRLQLSDDGGNSWQTLSNYDTFTQADINASEVRFVHDGSETHQSEFKFSVTSGGEQAKDGMFDINVDPTNDRPTATGGSKGPFNEGGTVQLGGDIIGMNDVDTANESGEPSGEASTDDLYFRVTTLPDDGALQRWDGSDWVDVTTDDLISKALLSASVNGGTSGIRYVHNGGDQPSNFSDNFDYVVRDDLNADSDPTVVKSQSVVGPADETGLPAYQQHLSKSATVDLSIAPINDAPIIQQDPGDAGTTVIGSNGDSETSANQPLNLAEGEQKTIGNDLLDVVDPDTPTDVRQYRITDNVDHGTLTLGGKTLGIGSRFTQADIDSGRLKYQHDGSENFSDGFDFIVSDSVSDHFYTDNEIGTPPGPSSFTINVDAARNDTPTIANNGPGTVDVFGDQSGFPTHDFGNNLSISDSDLVDGTDTAAGETDFIQARFVFRDSNGDPVDLTANGGGLTLGSQSGLTITDGDASDGTYAIQGNYADVKAALNGLSITVPNTDLNDTYSLDVSVDDRLRGTNGDLTNGANGDDNPDTNGSGQPVNEDGSVINATHNVDTTSVTFRVSDDNDAPTFTGTQADQSVNEDTVLDLGGYQIDDVDAFDSELTVGLSVDNGHLSVGNVADTGDPDSLTLTGTLDELNDQLSNLTYIDDLNFNSNDGNNGNAADDTLQIAVNDNGDNGSGGDNTISDSTDIAINPVNDPPSVAAPVTQTLDSGSNVTFSSSNGNGIDIGDAADYDNGQPVNDNLELTLAVQGNGDTPANNPGALTAATTGGLTVTSDGSNGTLVLQGSLDDLRAALDGLTYAPNDANADRTDTIKVSLNDLANGGNALAGGVGGALMASDNVDVRISGTNDAPSVDAPPTLTATEDGTLTLSGSNAFSVSDPDDFGADMTVSVSVNHGTIDASASGVTVTGGGTGTITLEGSESALNNALDGLTYTPTPDFHTAGVSVSGDEITVTINDEGNTGTGGAKTATQSATIDVKPVNDAPSEASGPYSTGSPNEDTDGGSGQTLSDLLGSGYADTTDNQSSNDGGNTATDLSDIAIVGSTDYTAAQGTWQVSDGSGGWIDVPASGLSDSNALIFDAARNVRFNPAADFFGTPGQLQVRVADSDNLAGSPTIANTSGSAGARYDLGDPSNGGLGNDNGRWSNTVSIESSVDGVNDRPNGADETLSAIKEGNLDPDGATIADLFGGDYSDAGDNQSGIAGGGNQSTELGGLAIVGNTAVAAQGAWQYSTDGGANWTDLDTSVADANATTLAATDRLRFQPVDNDYNDNSNGTAGAPGNLTVRLADSSQTQASGQDISGDLGDTSTWSLENTLSTSVNPVNDAPAATPSQNFTVSEDNGTIKTTQFMQGIQPDEKVLGGATDESGQTVSFGIKSTSDGSQFTANELFDTLPTFTDNDGANNTLSFKPSDILAKGESQTVTVTVGVKDDGGTANGGNETGADQTFTITIEGKNDAPTSIDNLPDQNDRDGDTITPIDTTGQFTDVDANDDLTYTATNLPPGLSIDRNTGKITGTLDADASQGGPSSDGVYNITITANDGNGGTATSDFDWTVTNPAPTAVADSDSTDQDSPISRDATNGVINPNDSDGGNDNDALSVAQVSVGGTYIAVSNGNPAIVIGDNGGEFTINADGSYDFDPSGDFDDLADPQQRDTTVRYEISDGQGGTDTATLAVTVTGANDAPTSTGSLPDQSDADGDPITPIDTSGAFDDVDANDTLTYSTPDLPPGLSIDPATGEITGTIDADASQQGTGGVYNVTVTATDTHGESATSTFDWTVTNPAPTAVNDSDSTTENATTSGNVITDSNGGADSDGGNDSDSLSVTQVDGNSGNVASAVTGDNGGTFTINAGGTYTFDPNGDFDDLSPGESRQTTVDYTVSDGQGDTDSATMAVTVRSDNVLAVAPPPSGFAGPQPAPPGHGPALGYAEHPSFNHKLMQWHMPAAQSSAMIFQATLTDGSPLPGTLTVDAATGNLSGHLPLGMDQAHITLIGVDANGDTRTRELWVNQAGQSIGQPNDNQAARDDSGHASSNASGDHRVDVWAGGAQPSRLVSKANGFSTLSVRGVDLQAGYLSVAIDDTRASDATAYTATLADGGRLPPGLTFDSRSGHIRGWLGGDTRALDIRIVAHDPDGGVRSLDLNLHRRAGHEQRGDWQPLSAQAAQALTATREVGYVGHGARTASALAR